LLLATEEHGLGRQLARFRIRPRPSAVASALAAGLLGLAAWATTDHAWLAAAVLGVAGAEVARRIAAQCGAAVGALVAAAAAADDQPPA
jgi:hypothetical protein